MDPYNERYLNVAADVILKETDAREPYQYRVIKLALHLRESLQEYTIGSYITKEQAFRLMNSEIATLMVDKNYGIEFYNGETERRYSNDPV